MHPPELGAFESIHQVCLGYQGNIARLVWASKGSCRYLTCSSPPAPRYATGDVCCERFILEKSEVRTFFFFLIVNGLRAVPFVCNRLLVVQVELLDEDNVSNMFPIHCFSVE